MKLQGVLTWQIQILHPQNLGLNRSDIWIVLKSESNTFFILSFDRRTQMRGERGDCWRKGKVQQNPSLFLPLYIYPPFISLYVHTMKDGIKNDDVSNFLLSPLCNIKIPRRSGIFFYTWTMSQTTLKQMIDKNRHEGWEW